MLSLYHYVLEEYPDWDWHRHGIILYDSQGNMVRVLGLREYGIRNADVSLDE